MKKMISFGVVTIMTCMIVNISIAQENGNYYRQCRKWEAYFNANPNLKNEEDGDYKQFERWKEFWRTRVNISDTNQNEQFSIYRDAINAYVRQSSTYQGNIERIYSDWHCLGPVSSSQQDIGQISAIYVDTVNDKMNNIIFVGTNSSGVWKTIDGGLNWRNITDWNDFYLNGIQKSLEIHSMPEGSMLHQEEGSWAMVIPTAPEYFDRTTSDKIGNKFFR